MLCRHSVHDVISTPPNYDGVTALHVAALLGSDAMVATLLAGGGADVNKQTSNGDTALYEACFEGT